MAFVATLAAISGGLFYVSQAGAALAPVTGTLVSGTINTAAGSTGVSPTLARGAAWVADTSAAGGHWWVGDQLGGLCRLDLIGGAAPNNGPYTEALCNGTAKAGGQVVVDDVPGNPNAKFLFVADASSKSAKVVRYTINNVNTANPTFGATLAMNVPNATQKGGGGTNSGRPVGLALITNPGVRPNPAPAGWPAAYAAGEHDLIVGYLKSGDIVRVFDVNHTGAGNPAQNIVASTSDGIGINAMAVVGTDVYVAEVGGLGGVSKLTDVAGVNRPACTSIAPCTASATGSGIGFPGGMATDGGQYLYVGDAAVGGGTNNIYRLDLATNPPTKELLSSTINPSVSAKDSNQVQTSYTSYVAPLGLGYRPTGATGELYVADDPQFAAAVVTNNQGHIWRIATPAAPPAVSSISPTSGTAAGGTVVTINGANFATAAGVTTVRFGATASAAVICTTTTTCTATSPPGTPGTVDVRVTVVGQTSAVVNADRFTYTATVPTISSVSPATGTEAGGTVLTINGTGLGSGANVTVGGVSATNISCASSTSCTATTPAAATAAPFSPVAVLVTVAGNSTTAPNAFTYVPVSIGSVAPANGDVAGGTPVTITGTGFSTTVPTTVTFADGINPAATAPATCATITSCTVTTPAHVAGAVNVTVTVGTRPSPTLGGAFTYTTTVVLGPQITSVAPTSGSTAGGTVVTINGANLGGVSITIGGNAVLNLVCSPATCTFDTPPSGSGPQPIVVSDGLNPAVSPGNFTYNQAVASLYAWGITAPKGGAVWLPGSLGGHWWSSDHAQGFCRQDPLPGIPGRFAINYAVCGDDAVGSAGQGVYDPRPVTVGSQTFNNLHYVYVPDNAVKSVAVWRLTFDSSTETMVPDPIDGITTATGMIPLASVKTLKPNGMALGPLDANGVFCGLASANCTAAQKAAIGLYVTDLTDPFVRYISRPEGDPRLQTVTSVAATGDNRGANGTTGFIGSYLYVSGNRATQFFDVTLCPIGGNPCGMASVPSPTGVFVAGTAVDAARHLVYQSNSPGGAAASVLRYDASHDVYVAWDSTAPPPGISTDVNGVQHCEAFLGNPGIGCILGPTSGNYIDSGTAPGFGAPIQCALTCTRPWDFANRPTANTSFAFAFGLAVGPAGELIITEDPSAGARSARGSMWTVPFTG